MIAEEERFAAELARAIADDVHAHPPGGELVRVVLRWFEAADPLYFTVHALGEEEAQEVPADDAWYPLEWPNVDDELERTERVADDPGVQEAGEALAAVYAETAEEVEETGEVDAVGGHRGERASARRRAAGRRCAACGALCGVRGALRGLGCAQGAGGHRRRRRAACPRGTGRVAARVSIFAANRTRRPP
jgi:hypothetical protein